MHLRYPLWAPHAKENLTPLSALFPDVGMQLAVLGSVMSAGVFSEEDIAERVSALAEKDYGLNSDEQALEVESKRAKEALAILGGILIEPGQLEKITNLSFDGGDDIYMTLEGAIDIDTGGEEDWYECKSVSGVQRLPNLKSSWNDGYFRVESLASKRKQPLST
jgi:hypothetical protein